MKRVQPGFVVDADNWEQFTHGCSTLAGSSGSCVVSLSTGVVVGLHVGGRYLQENYAVPLRSLAGNERMLDLGARFVE